MPLPNIKPSFIRQYPLEYAVIALAGAVIFLFLSLNDLHKYIRTEMRQQNETLIRTIEKNTEALMNLRPK